MRVRLEWIGIYVGIYLSEITIALRTWEDRLFSMNYKATRVLVGMFNILVCTKICCCVSITTVTQTQVCLFRKQSHSYFAEETSHSYFCIETHWFNETSYRSKPVPGTVVRILVLGMLMGNAQRLKAMYGHTLEMSPLHSSFSFVVIKYHSTYVCIEIVHQPSLGFGAVLSRLSSGSYQS